MKLYSLIIVALLGSVNAVEIGIPQSKDGIVTFWKPAIIVGTRDFENQEFDRGVNCDEESSNNIDDAVFILADGAVLSNVIIGAKQRGGIYCRGACMLKNVWFRDVCQNAITAQGTGSITVTGGGAQRTPHAVFQHDGQGVVLIREYRVADVGTVYRSCWDCPNNGGPRMVWIDDLRANGVSSEIVAINSNYQDVASIQDSCGSNIAKICQEYEGIDRYKSASGSTPLKLETKNSCLGNHGKAQELGECTRLKAF